MLERRDADIAENSKSFGFLFFLGVSAFNPSFVWFAIRLCWSLQAR